MEKLTLTVSDVQHALGISKNAAYELANSAGFPTIRLGRKILIPREAFLRWLDAQTDQVAG